MNELMINNSDFSITDCSLYSWVDKTLPVSYEAMKATKLNCITDRTDYVPGRTSGRNPNP